MKKNENKKKQIAELVRYGIAGGTTTIVNIGIYHGLVLLRLDYRAANLIAIICSKIYGYLVNKVFVFKSHCSTNTELLQEIGKFIGARGITGLVDYTGLIVLVEAFSLDKVMSKYVVNVIVIVLNYVFGKFIVFKRKPARNAKKMQTKYNTGNIEKYESKNPLKRVMVEKLNKRILDSINNMIGDKKVIILDAGCGEGYIDKLLAERFPNSKITGLEFTEEAIKIAKERNKTVNYIQGDVGDMPFENNSFDLVICTEVLEHLNNPEMALQELVRVSNGSLLITVPHEPWFCLGNLLVLKNVTRLGNPIDHVNHWTQKSFSEFLKRSKMRGWIIEKSFPWIIAKNDVDQTH